MRLIGLLAFYDEPPSELVASISSLTEMGVTELVAVDGAYGLFPDAQPASHPNQHAAIDLACKQLGMGCTLHIPSGVWEGNECEKRTFLFKLGWAIAEPGDWFVVHDADMVVMHAPQDLKDRLAATERDVAEVEILDTVAQRFKQPDWPERFEFPGLYRAQPITVGPHHGTYTTADGRHLRGETANKPAEPCLDLTGDVLVEHRPDRRPMERSSAKLVYYRRREEECVERGACSRCGAPAIRLVATRWRMTHIGPVAEWREACEPCADVLDRVGRAELVRLGVDPDTVVVENRNGHAPAGMAAH